MNKQINNTNEKGKIFYVIFSILIILAFVIYFTYPSSTERTDETKFNGDYYEFGDHLFIKNDFDAWDFNVKNNFDDRIYTISLRNLPTEVESIPLRGDVSTFWRHKETIYLVFDPNLSGEELSALGLTMVDLTLNLGKAFSVDVDTACKTEGDGCKRIAKSCDFAPYPMIEFIHSEKPGLESPNSNCIKVYGNKTTISKSTEKLLYIWYDILK